MGKAFDGPWLIIKVYNAVVNQSDNSGGRPMASSKGIRWENLLIMEGWWIWVSVDIHSHGITREAIELISKLGLTRAWLTEIGGYYS